MPAHGERLVCVGVATRAVRLSVLTPFHRHDPSPLLDRLAGGPSDVEFVLLDDGSGSAELLAKVISTAERVGAPVRIVVWGANRGRAQARNRLIAEARGEYVLFLDADMIPDATNFLDVWLGLIQTQRPYVAFGGLSLTHAPQSPETALHRDLFGRSDCLPARVRQRRPAQAVAASNLLVHRGFLQSTPFDDSYAGWGFEDVDWALTAAARAPILHVDNPATHSGLDTVETLLRKSAEAGPNFARLAAKHPRQVARFTAHRAGRLLQLTPARNALRAFFEWLARDPIGAAPLRVRTAALKLYRATHYAEHLV